MVDRFAEPPKVASMMMPSSFLRIPKIIGITVKEGSPKNPLNSGEKKFSIETSKFAWFKISKRALPAIIRGIA